MAINPDKTIRKIVSFPKELWGRVDDYRFSQRHRSEADAIRRLVEIGLEAAERDDAVTGAATDDDKEGQ